jgi:hypothetical protein
MVVRTPYHQHVDKLAHEPPAPGMSDLAHHLADADAPRLRHQLDQALGVEIGIGREVEHRHDQHEEGGDALDRGAGGRGGGGGEGFRIRRARGGLLHDHAAPAGLAVAVLEVGAFLEEVLHEVLALLQQLWADPDAEADDEQQDKQADDRERPMRRERGMACHPLGRATQGDREQGRQQHQQQLAME